MNNDFLIKMKFVILFYILHSSGILLGQSDWHYKDKNPELIAFVNDHFGDMYDYIGTRNVDGDMHVLLLQKGSVVHKGEFIESTLVQTNMSKWNRQAEGAGLFMTALCDCESMRMKITYLLDLETNVQGATGYDWIIGIGDSWRSRVLDHVCSYDMSNMEYVDLYKEGGVYKVPVRLNNSLTAFFIFDTGAADILISKDIFSALSAKGHLDFEGTARYRLANGDVVLCNQYVLPSVKIGEREVYNVRCAVATNGSSELLLGQAFLEKLGRFEFDYTSSRLIFR